MLLTPLFKSFDVPTKVGPSGTQEQCWPDVLPAGTNDSYGTSDS